MKITLLASFLVMAAYFLLLYAGVGLIQEKKFFSSAPREVFAAPQLFGYNKKAHFMHFLLYIPLSAALAWVCTLF